MNRNIMKEIRGYLKRGGNIIRSEGKLPFVFMVFNFIYRKIIKKSDLVARTLIPPSLYIRFHHWRNTKGYQSQALADPYKLIYIDPKSINKYVDGKYGTLRWYHTGTIDDGDWDKEANDLEENIIYRTLKQRFSDGKKWHNTELVQKSLRGERSWRGNFSEEGIRKRCDEMDELYKDMKENGYKESSEISELNYPYSKLDNINVAISRDGELILADGRHRLAIAKILGIEKIPVRVVARHKMWQRTREKLYKCINEEGVTDKNIDRRYRNHPDLEDIMGRKKI
jgi:hypothetical protein